MRLSQHLSALALCVTLVACTTVDDGTSADTTPGQDALTQADIAADNADAADFEDATSPVTDVSTVPEDISPPEDTSAGIDADPVTDAACEGEADGTPCDDGNMCTTDDACSAGQCVGGSNLVCDATDPCRTPGCDPEIGCYTTEVADGTPCSAGCFESASCQGGSCTVDPESAVVCPEPEEPCVDQLQCDPQTGACTRLTLRRFPKLSLPPRASSTHS